MGTRRLLFHGFALIAILTGALTVVSYLTPLYWDLSGDNCPWRYVRLAHGSGIIILSDTQDPPLPSRGVAIGDHREYPILYRFLSEHNLGLARIRLRENCMEPLLGYPLELVKLDGQYRRDMTLLRRQVVDAIAGSFAHNVLSFDSPQGKQRQQIIYVRLYLLVVLFGAYPVISVLHQGVRRYRRGRRGQCIECGYDLRHNTLGVCPECGTETEKVSKTEKMSGKMS